MTATLTPEQAEDQLALALATAAQLFVELQPGAQPEFGILIDDELRQAHEVEVLIRFCAIGVEIRASTIQGGEESHVIRTVELEPRDVAAPAD